MIWVAEILSPNTNIGDYLISVGGPLGIIIIGLVIALLYYVRKADKIQEKLDEERNKRLEDEKARSITNNLPFQELTRFVGNLYDQSVNTGKRN